MTPIEPMRFTFTRAMRLRSSKDFDAVFAARRRRSRGPVAVHVLENDLGFSRLGISIGRRHGNAVRRNAIKRRVREAFRLNRHRLPKGLDIVATFKPHAPLSMGEYAELLLVLVGGEDHGQRSQRNKDSKN